MYKIYTDGSAIKLPKVNSYVGGFSFVLVQEGRIIEKFSEGITNTTNNRTEMTALIEAQKHCLLNDLKEVEIFSDSQYVVKGHNEWIDLWIRRPKKNLLNPDLWQIIYEQRQALRLAGFVIKVTWVKGHDGNYYNEMADRLAGEKSSIEYQKEANPFHFRQ